MPCDWAPEASSHLIAFHETVLRGESPLTVGERELIAAFVSGLNACAYCHGVHKATARAFGIDETLLEHLVADPHNSPADPRMKPLLRFVRKLTLNASKMTKQDADAVLKSVGTRALYTMR